MAIAELRRADTCADRSSRQLHEAQVQRTPITADSLSCNVLFAACWSVTRACIASRQALVPLPLPPRMAAEAGSAGLGSPPWHALPAVPVDMKKPPSAALSRWGRDATEPSPTLYFSSVRSAFSTSAHRSLGSNRASISSTVLLPAALNTTGFPAIFIRLTTSF
jgi:hypothetical protein